LVDNVNYVKYIGYLSVLVLVDLGSLKDSRRLPLYALQG
jgi:hypothetical protein